MLLFSGKKYLCTLVCLVSELEFEISIYQFESARKLLAEPGAGTSARSLFFSCQKFRLNVNLGSFHDSFHSNSGVK